MTPLLAAEFQIMNPPTLVSLIIGGNIKFFWKKRPHLHLINTPNFKKKVPEIVNLALFRPPHFITTPYPT